MKESNNKRIYHSIDPVYDKNSKILILGSFPSIVSRDNNFYYAHPKNRFWKVLGELYNIEFNTIEDKKKFLLDNYIALYDVVKSCTITGSSDSSIKDIEINDIKSIVKNSNITKIYTTGKTSYNLYNKYLKDIVGIDAIYLPSTSPANATISYNELLNYYKIIKQP